jgi:hypothetical protein
LSLPHRFEDEAKMIQENKADLSEGFDIQFVNVDCALDFPGYAVEAVQGVNNVFHLAKV